MSATRSVRTTLLDALFRRPKPIAAREYQQARGNLFPGERLFVDFLETDDSQELMFLARRILLRLSYSQRLVAPSRLLLNLADFEQNVRDKVTKGDYIPRDHFVHLVNLYLLGVYFFAYHRPLHTHCVAALSEQKRKFLRESHKRANLETGSSTGYHLFARVWSHFVLFHDLGYPIEKTFVSDRKQSKRFFKPFQRAMQSVLNDLSLRGLSRMAVFRVLTRERGATLAQMYLDHEENFVIQRNSYQEVKRKDLPYRGAETGSAEAIACAIFDGCEDARFMARISGAEGLRLVGTLVPDAKVWSVLEGSGGEGIAVLRRSERQKVAWLVHPIRERLTVTRSPEVLWRQAFIEGRTPLQSQSWRYFISGADSSLRLIAGLGRKEIEDFDALVEKLEQNDGWGAASVDDGDLQENLGFAAYEALANGLGYIDDDLPFERLSRDFGSAHESFKTVSRELPSLVAKSVERLLKTGLEAKKDRFSPIEILLENSPREAARQLAEGMWEVIESSGKGAFKKAVEESVDTKLRTSAEFEGMVREWQTLVVNVLASNLGRNKNKVEVGNPYSTLAFDDSLGCDTLAASGIPGQPVSKHLDASGLHSFDALLRMYRPGWAEQSQPGLGSRVMDHGLVSAGLALGLGPLFEGLVDHIKSLREADYSGPAWLFRTCLRTISRVDESWLDLERGMLSEDVAFAIAIHNLYPADLPEMFGNHRTRLAREPFAYLALLADGMQQWDRRALVDLVSSDDVRALPGSRFDLRISGNKIEVFVYATRLNIEAEKKQLRDVLDSYLENASRFVQLSLNEFRTS